MFNKAEEKTQNEFIRAKTFVKEELGDEMERIKDKLENESTT